MLNHSKVTADAERYTITVASVFSLFLSALKTVYPSMLTSESLCSIDDVSVGPMKSWFLGLRMSSTYSTLDCIVLGLSPCMLRKENAFSLSDFVVALPSFVEATLCSRSAVAFSSHKVLLETLL